MKTIIIHSLLFCSFVLMVLPGLSPAQTISINSVSATSFCSGDPIAVTFTATGTWEHKNAFTLQLSDKDGSFTNGVFINIGSLFDTVSGTYTISATVSINTVISQHYRFRVIGGNPYIASADNGYDISIGGKTSHLLYRSPPLAINTPIIFEDAYWRPTPDTVYWTFGDGAEPATAITIGSHLTTRTFTYSSGGLKTKVMRIVRPGGCNTTDTVLTYIYDCSTRQIPHDAIVIDRDTDISSGARYANVWVNPGVTLICGGFDTVYAESGATISGGASIVFLKAGASYSSGFANVVICDEAASVFPGFGGNAVLKCPDLHFDYTNAPPNIAFPRNGVNTKVIAKAITLSPNPTSGIINVNDAPINLLNVSVLNLLGANVMEVAKPNASSFQIDLTKLTPGIYYLRFAMPGAVVTKKIIRE